MSDADRPRARRSVDELMAVWALEIAELARSFEVVKPLPRNDVDELLADYARELDELVASDR